MKQGALSLNDNSGEEAARDTCYSTERGHASTGSGRDRERGLAMANSIAAGLQAIDGKGVYLLRLSIVSGGNHATTQPHQTYSAGRLRRHGVAMHGYSESSHKQHG